MSASPAALSAWLLGGLVLAGAALWYWRRRSARHEHSAYEWHRLNQREIWHGVPVTVTFDYEPYLKAPMRRKINLHTVNEGGNGERSIIGFCHDRGEDRTFTLHAIRGDVTVAKTGESLSGAALVEALVEGRLTSGPA